MDWIVPENSSQGLRVRRAEEEEKRDDGERTREDRRAEKERRVGA